MAITNPNRVVKVSQLNYFKTKADALYQTKAISAITGLSAETVEAALSELLGKIQAIPSAIIPKGTRTFSQLAPSTDLVAGSLGFMWNISDAFTTTSDFAEGSGKPVAAGSNIYVANVGTAAEPSYKYDIFAGPIDLSGYALKSEMSVEAGTGVNADKTTITLKSGTSATVLTTHQDISGKVDKIETEAFSAEKAYAEGDYVTYDNKLYQFTAAHAAGAWAGTDAKEITGDFAMYDKNGNLVDSGKKASDFATAAQGTKADSAVQSVALAGGTNNGTVKLTVDGTATDNIAVTGLGTAAYKADTYFEPAITYATDSDIDEMFPSA
jgi:hypothetical protein